MVRFRRFARRLASALARAWCEKSARRTKECRLLSRFVAFCFRLPLALALPLAPLGCLGASSAASCTASSGGFSASGIMVGTSATEETSSSASERQRPWFTEACREKSEERVSPARSAECSVAWWLTMASTCTGEP